MVCLIRIFYEPTQPTCSNGATMTNVKAITRNVIIQTLIESLKPLDIVHAFYEGGAAAFNRIDKWSDIDLYAIVQDEKVEETFIAVENALKSLRPIKQKLRTPQLPWPGISQIFYKLEAANEYLLVDFAVLKQNAPEKFLQPEIHGNVVFYFNNLDKIGVPQLDGNALAKRIIEHMDRLQARFDMFGNFVQKELNRGNCLEAIELYHALILGSLVEVLRIKHNPFHHDFRMRYIHYELSSEAIEKLKHLYFIRDEKDLQKRYKEAAKWFHDTMSKINREQIKRSIKM